MIPLSSVQTPAFLWWEENLLNLDTVANLNVADFLSDRQAGMQEGRNVIYSSWVQSVLILKISKIVPLLPLCHYCICILTTITTNITVSTATTFN